MNFLLDTNVISEATRSKPELRVLAWLDQADEDRLFLSAVTLAELHYGIERLADGKRKRLLHEWLHLEIPERFKGRILPMDAAVAESWGKVAVESEARGAPVGVMDGFIAATARVHNLTLVTRNRSDFQDIVPRTYDPWTEN